MKYLGMPAGMWALFAASFRAQLTGVLGYDRAAAERITKAAHGEYRALIAHLPDFETGDRFQMNIVSCAMLSAFVLNMPRRPTVDALTDYYAAAMMTGPMKWFCRMSGKKKFSAKDVEGMKKTAALNAADRNPYSWNMEFLPYPDGSAYIAGLSKRCIHMVDAAFHWGHAEAALFTFAELEREANRRGFITDQKAIDLGLEGYFRFRRQ